MAKNVTSADLFSGMFARLPAQERETQGKEERHPESLERSRLHPFKNHPFRVVEDEQMEELAESIRNYGIQEPILVRPDKENGGYEIISGHRRCHAAGMAGLDRVPVHIREMSDSLATVLMVDANNKREILLPSEKAWAYRMKADALRHQGKRNDLTGEAETEEGMAAVSGKGLGSDSVRTVQRYIRLTYLLDELLQACDAGKLSVSTGYALSYFSKEEQEWIVSYYRSTGKLPDAGQMETLKKLKRQGGLTLDGVQAVFMEKKPAVTARNITVKEKCLSRYFPEDATKEYMESVILDLLEQWAKEQEDIQIKKMNQGEMDGKAAGAAE